MPGAEPVEGERVVAPVEPLEPDEPVPAAPVPVALPEAPVPEELEPLAPALARASFRHFSCAVVPVIFMQRARSSALTVAESLPLAPLVLEPEPEPLVPLLVPVPEPLAPVLVPVPELVLLEPDPVVEPAPGLDASLPELPEDVPALPELPALPAAPAPLPPAPPACASTLPAAKAMASVAANALSLNLFMWSPIGE